MRKMLSVVTMVVLAQATFGGTYERGKVYGPITITEAAVEIDGNGAIIDGGGTNRCATLGPGVTLKNFTFRNGAAALAGGVYGGRLENCTITGCASGESGAALGDCVAVNCQITGNRHTASSSTASCHGGIVYGSKLTNCTLSGNVVEFGSAAPAFGGLGESVEMTSCTVKDNTLSFADGVCYGRFFSDTTIDKTYGEFWDDASAFSGEDPVDPVDPVDPEDPDNPDDPDDPDDPKVPFVLYADTAIMPFTAAAAATYNGWLRDPTSGEIVAMLQVKTTAAKAGKASKTTVFVTPVGGKKKSYKSTVLPDGNPEDAFGIVYGGLALKGAVHGLAGVADGALVEAAKDFTKAKDPSEKAMAKRIPVGCRTLALDTGDGYDCLSVSVAKSGKASIKGSLADGTAITISSMGAVGEKAFAIPVAYSKTVALKTTGARTKVTFAFVLWIAADGGEVGIAGLTGGRWNAEGIVLGRGLLTRPQDGLRVIGFNVPVFADRVYYTQIDGFNVTPDGLAVTVAGKKWNIDKTVGTVKAVAGVPTVSYKSGTPANLTKMKLTYTDKTGVVKGSCKLYYPASGKVKTESVTIGGIVVDGEFYGNAVIKKKGGTQIWWE